MPLGVRRWAGLGLLVVFLAGIGHVWLHDAHIGDGSHFGAAVEKACPSEKLVAVVTAAGFGAPAGFERDRNRTSRDQWRRIALNVATAPRGPPHS